MYPSEGHIPPASPQGLLDSAAPSLRDSRLLWEALLIGKLRVPISSWEPCLILLDSTCRVHRPRAAYLSPLPALGAEWTGLAGGPAPPPWGPAAPRDCLLTFT